MSARLKKGDITIKEMLDLSLHVYGREVDNKKFRMELDVKSAKLQIRNNIEYNRSTHKWEQKGRDVKIIALIRTNPVSYKKQDDLDYHYYPLYFLIHEWDKKFDSSFRWRTGSFYKWKKSNKKVSDGKSEGEKEQIRKSNKKILEENIKRGIQAQFLFELMYTARQYQLLYGAMTCENRPPKKTNPHSQIFFDKHALYFVLFLLPKIFSHPLIGAHINSGEAFSKKETQN